MPDIKQQLSQDIANTNWQDLLPHARRDAIIVVKEELNLLDVGTAIAEDNTVLVQNWIQQAAISKPSANQLTIWNSQPQHKFMALIVQPFVIIQELTS